MSDVSNDTSSSSLIGQVDPNADPATTNATGADGYDDIVNPLLSQGEAQYQAIKDLLNSDDATDNPLLASKLTLMTNLMEGMVEGANAVASSMSHMVQNAQQKMP